MRHKKRAMIILLSAGLLLNSAPSVPHTALALDFNAGFVFPQTRDPKLWKYTIIESQDGISDTPFIHLEKYDSIDEDIIIPEKIDGYPVLSVGSSIIEGDISSYIYIPDSVIALSNDFANKQQCLTIVTESGDRYRLTDDKKTGKNGFILEQCGDRKNIVIPDNIGGIPVIETDSGILSVAKSAETVSLPDSIYSMYGCTFSDCPNLRKVNIPKGVKILPSETFYNVPKLEEVDLPDDLLYIAQGAFPSDCAFSPPTDKVVHTLGNFYYTFDPFYVFDPETNWTYCIQAVDPDYTIKTKLVYAPNLEGEPPAEFLGNAVEYEALNEIPMYQPVVTVGKTQTLLNVPSYIACNVEKLNILSNDLTVENAGFSGSLIDNVIFPGNVSLGINAFTKNNKLTKVVFNGENKVIRIGQNCFAENRSLKELVLPESCEILDFDTECFKYTKLSFVEFPTGNVTLGRNSFANCVELESIVLNSGAVVQKDAFRNCLKLKEITIKGNTTLSSSAFNECKNLTNININTSMPINFEGFNHCLALSSINGEEVFEEDGTPKEKYLKFIEDNCKCADDNGIVNGYVKYRIKKLVNEVCTDDMNDMQKLKAIHDKICSMVTYDDNNLDEKNHVDVSVFLNDSTVCDGYARAMNLALNEVGIESCYVSNYTHAWVIVKMGDHYFHVDTTWDDGDVVCYDWFLRADKQITFDSDHRTWKLNVPSSLHQNQCSELPKCTDLMGDVNMDGTLDGRDASAILTAYARASVETDEEPDIDMILADFNFDGKLDATDASKVLKEYAASFTENNKHPIPE